MPSIESIYNWGKTTGKQLDEVVPANRKFRGSLDPTAVLPNKGFTKAYLEERPGKVESTSITGRTRTVVTEATPAGERSDEDPILSIPYEGQRIFVNRWFGWEKDPNTSAYLYNPSQDVADGAKDTEPALVVVTNVDPSNPNNNDWEVLRLEGSAAQYKAAVNPNGAKDIVPITKNDGKLSLDVIPSLPTGAIYEVSDSSFTVFSDWLADGSTMHNAIDGITSNGELNAGDRVIFFPEGQQPAEQWLLKDDSDVTAPGNWIKTGTSTGGGGGDVDAATESTLGTILLATQDQVNGRSGFDDQDRPLVVMPDHLEPWMDDLLSGLSNLGSVTSVNPEQPNTVDEYHSTKLLGYSKDNTERGAVPVKEVSRRLHSDLTVNGVSVGGLDNDETLDKGESFEDILRKMLQQINHPSYQKGSMAVTPDASRISGFGNRRAFTKQRGNTLYVEATRNFEPLITWNTTRNDFGPVDQVRLRQNNSTLETKTSADGFFGRPDRTYGPGTGDQYDVFVDFNNTQDNQLKSNNLQDGGSNSVGGYWEVGLGSNGGSPYRDAKNSFYNAEKTKYSSGRLVDILTLDRTVAFVGRGPMYRMFNVKGNLFPDAASNKGGQDPDFGIYSSYEDLATDTRWTTSAKTLKYESGNSKKYGADGYLQFMFALPARLNTPSLEYRPNVGQGPFNPIPWDKASTKNLSGIDYTFASYVGSGSNFQGGEFKLSY